MVKISFVSCREKDRRGRSAFLRSENGRRISKRTLATSIRPTLVPKNRLLRANKRSRLPSGDEVVGRVEDLLVVDESDEMPFGGVGSRHIDVSCTEITRSA